MTKARSLTSTAYVQGYCLAAKIETVEMLSFPKSASPGRESVAQLLLSYLLHGVTRLLSTVQPQLPSLLSLVFSHGIHQWIPASVARRLGVRLQICLNHLASKSKLGKEAGKRRSSFYSDLSAASR